MIKPKCFGDQDAYNFNPEYIKDKICERCAVFKQCRKETFNKIANIEKNLNYYEFNKRG